MTRLVLVLSILLAPVTAFGDPVTISGKTFTPDMSEVWRPDDPELTRLVERFNKNFYKNERRFRRQLEAKRQRIIAEGLDDKTAEKLKRAEASYVRNSTLNVAKYREPLLERMKHVANRGLNKAGALDDTAGEKLYLKLTDEEIAARAKAGKGPRALNPNYGGALSDKDMGGSSLASNRFSKLVRHYFGDTVETVDGKRIPTVTKTTDAVHTVEAKFLEATVNVTPKVYDPSKGTFYDPDAGSSSQDAKYRSMANNDEVYLNVSARDQPGAKQMEAFDHFTKGAEARRVPAAKHVDPAELSKVRPLYKTTYKMADELSEAEFNTIKAKTGYRGSFASFKDKVERIKKKASMDAVGVDRGNVAAFKATAEAVQDRVLEKSNAEWRLVQSAETNAIRRAEAELATLEGNAKEAKTREIVDRKRKLIDSRARMNALQSVADEKRSGVSPAPEKVTPIPSKKTVRVKINRKIEGWIEAGSPKLARVTDSVEKVTWAVRVGSELYQGNVGGAAKEVGAIAFEEARDRVHLAIGNRIIPGYGKLKLAYDVGYGTGRLVGEHVKLYPGGPTVDEAAQNFFEEAHDIASGNREKRWENQRLQDYHRFVGEMIDDWGAELPPGMTRGQAMAYAIEKDNAGGNFHRAMEELFDAGDKAKAEREAERRELADAVKRAALADAAASKAKNAAERAPPPAPPAAVGGLRDLLVDKKAETRRDPRADGGGGMGRVFDSGTQTIGKYRQLERAKRDLKEARRHLANVRARIAARKRRQEAERRRRANSMSGFGKTLSKDADSYSRQYQKYLNQFHQAKNRPKRPSSSSAKKLTIGVNVGGRDMTKPAWVKSSTSRPNTRRPSGRKSCKTFRITASSCQSAFERCMRGCPKRTGWKDCHMKCGNVDTACKRSSCPSGTTYKTFTGWRVTCTACR